MRFRFASCAVIIVGATASYAQLSTQSFSGSVFQNGSAFAGGDLNLGDQIRLEGNAANPLSQLAFAARANPGVFFPNRYMMKFDAEVDGASVLMPSDREGNKTSAVDGESRIFSTWDTNLFGQTNEPHNFSMEVQASGSDTGAIDLDIQQAPRPTSAISSGSYVVDRLDNSIYDTDSTVGQITVNKLLTPTITLNFVLPEITFTRTNTTWSDSTETASAFRDDVSSGMWFLLGGQIFGDEFSPAQTFAAGEGAGSKAVNPYSDSITMDWSDIANGTYTGKSWAIGWNTFGYDSDLGGLSIGDIETEYLDTAINVVPEPATLAVLGLGLAALARRRKSA